MIPGVPDDERNDAYQCKEPFAVQVQKAMNIEAEKTENKRDTGANMRILTNILLPCAYHAIDIKQCRHNNRHSEPKKKKEHNVL